LSPDHLERQDEPQRRDQSGPGQCRYRGTFAVVELLRWTAEQRADDAVVTGQPADLTAVAVDDHWPLLSPSRITVGDPSQRTLGAGSDIIPAGSGDAQTDALGWLKTFPRNAWGVASR